MQKLLNSFAGDEEILQDAAKKFLEQLPRQKQELRQYLAQNDSRGFQILAHTLKGLFSTFCAAELKLIFAELEQLGKTRKLQNADSRLLASDKLISQLEAELELFLKQRKAS